MKIESDQFNYNWPKVEYNKLQLQDLAKEATFTVKPLVFPIEIVEYLMIVCDQLKISVASFQLTLSIASRYLRKKPKHLPLQLVIITSLMITCKFIETNPPEISTLHKVSCNSFTNKDFYRTEMLIVNQIDFDILAEGIPNRSIELVVRCVKSILRLECQQIFPTIVTDLQLLFWGLIYSGKITLRQGQQKAIAATLVHLASIFLTQFSGRFLQTLWACELTNADQKVVISLSNRVLKQILGAQKSKQYKI